MDDEDGKEDPVDRLLRDAISRINGGDHGAGLTDEVGKAIDEVAAAAPPDSDDSRDVEGIQRKHKGDQNGCRETSPKDLQRVREINENNRSRGVRDSLQRIVNEESGSSGSDNPAPTSAGGKIRIYQPGKKRL